MELFQALKLSKEWDLVAEEFSGHMCLAEVQLKAAKLRDALTHIDSAYEIAPKLDDKHKIVDVFFLHAKVMKKIHDLNNKISFKLQMKNYKSRFRGR